MVLKWGWMNAFLSCRPVSSSLGANDDDNVAVDANDDNSVTVIQVMRSQWEWWRGHMLQDGAVWTVWVHTASSNCCQCTASPLRLLGNAISLFQFLPFLPLHHLHHRHHNHCSFTLSHPPPPSSHAPIYLSPFSLLFTPFRFMYFHQYFHFYPFFLICTVCTVCSNTLHLTHDPSRKGQYHEIFDICFFQLTLHGPHHSFLISLSTTRRYSCSKVFIRVDTPQNMKKTFFLFYPVQ
jgi:hypothetical protein